MAVRTISACMTELWANITAHVDICAWFRSNCGQQAWYIYSEDIVPAAAVLGAGDSLPLVSPIVNFVNSHSGSIQFSVDHDITCPVVELTSTSGVNDEGPRLNFLFTGDAEVVGAGTPSRTGASYGDPSFAIAGAQGAALVAAGRNPRIYKSGHVTTTGGICPSGETIQWNAAMSVACSGGSNGTVTLSGDAVFRSEFTATSL